MHRSSLTTSVTRFATGLLLSATLAGGAFGADTPNPGKGRQVETLSRDGLDIEFSVQAYHGSAPGTARTKSGVPVGRDLPPLKAGDLAEFMFRINSADSGQGVASLSPGAWVDLAKPWNGEEGALELDCKDRVSMYLRKLVGIRPMLDLNSYYVMVMNDDTTISVIDPAIGITGITKLYAQIVLKEPGGDWAKNLDENRVFVSVPLEDQIAVIDANNFTITQYIDAGDNPLRIVLQPDQKYLWVGNDSWRPEASGVTVIDADSLAQAAFIPTGAGHHEIVFSADSRYAFVSNRDAGTVSVIDVQTLAKIRDLDTGTTPISLAYSALAQAVYVADGQEGIIRVIDEQTQQISGQIEAKPGLGPTRISQDGRWGFSVNPSENTVYIFDTATNALVHELPVEGKPYQVSLTRAFAYIRALDSERVSMINLVELAKGGIPPVVTFAAGQKAPSKASKLSIADSIVEAVGEAAVMVASPGDQTVYYYMEGMNAPMGNFRNYGHRPAAVMITNRSLRETEAGVYSTRIRVPEAGTYDVAFLLNSPQILHCFQFTAEPNPQKVSDAGPLKVEYLIEDRRVSAGELLNIRFRLLEPASGQPQAGLEDVRMVYYRAPGYDRTELVAQDMGEGVYSVDLTLPSAGAYYLYPGVPTMKVGYGDLDFLTLMAADQTAQNVQH